VRCDWAFWGDEWGLVWLLGKRECGGFWLLCGWMNGGISVSFEVWVGSWLSKYGRRSHSGIWMAGTAINERVGLIPMCEDAIMDGWYLGYWVLWSV
jgi:hypothetical protein